MGAASVLTTTVGQYLDYDDAASCRNEFHDGEVFRIDDITREHAVIQKNLLAGMDSRLAKSPCVPMGPARFHAIGKDYVYPDISVICGAPEYSSDGRSLANPSLIVEILSPSTADYDSGAKFRLYRQMRSLKEYVLVSQHSALLEVYRKDQAGDWVLSSYRGLDLSVPFASLGVSLPMAEIYKGVDLE